MSNLADSFFEQAAQVTKAYAYDILVKQVVELKAENERLRGIIKNRDEIIDNIFKLIDNFTGKTITNEPNTNRVAE